MKIIISGGGTGGHIYPALVIANEIKSRRHEKDERHEILYIGSAGGMEETIVPRAGVPIQSITTGALRGIALWKTLYHAAKIARGTWRAWRIMHEFAPDAVFVTGGYVSVPVVLAARLYRCPVMIYLPDIEPGQAIRNLARLARRVAVSFDKSLDYFPPGKAFVSGYPVRTGLYARDKRAARRRLGLSPMGKVLLVFGGSQGAHSINRAVGNIVPALVQYGEIIHIHGKVDGAWLYGIKRNLPASLQEQYHLHDYLYDEMTAALQAADLVIARSGAATLGEFPAAALPAILIPYPYAGQHQELNADYLVQHGAAVKLKDAILAEQLQDTIMDIWLDDAHLAQMRDNMRNLARPEAARRIVEEIGKLGNQQISKSAN